MTEIRLYNTASRRKEDFAPIDAQNVRMYVCGPTVYDRAHLGNARPVVVFDVLYRLLRHVYGPDHVTYVRNFTDVDDKINKRATETGRAIGDITAETTQWFLDDMAALGALEPDAMPRATQYIPQMVAMIEDLIERGHAYVAAGHVLFAVESYAEYGRLSGRSVDDMIAGARVEIAPYKRNPMDFVLWKPSTPDLPGWDSPWGRGRPGWHIECSAMSHELLGESFDIHGGGNDLMFPHHENEIAQSRCAHPDGKFARYWMHNEMLQVEGRKMSKSLGNFFTVRDLLDQGVPGEVIRFVFLSTHYRKPMDWTEKKSDDAKQTLLYWHSKTSELVPTPTNKFVPHTDIVSALEDDLNTHLALTILRALHNEPQLLLDNARFLGFLSDSMREGFQESALPGVRMALKGEGAQVLAEKLFLLRDPLFEKYQHAREVVKEANKSRSNLSGNPFESVDRVKSVLSGLGIKTSFQVDTVVFEATRDITESELLRVDALLKELDDRK